MRLRAEGVVFRYPGSSVPALDDGSDEVEQRLVLLATEDDLIL